MEGDTMKQDKPKKEALRRLKIIEGHLRKVADMLEEDKYCIDILQQSLAVQNALKKVDNMILERHLQSCVSDAMKAGKMKKEKATKELLKIYELHNK